MNKFIIILLLTSLMFAEDFQIISNGEERTFKMKSLKNIKKNFIKMIILMHGQGFLFII